LTHDLFTVIKRVVASGLALARPSQSGRNWLPAPPLAGANGVVGILTGGLGIANGKKQRRLFKKG